ncbi:MAG: hypothetical protein ACRD2O_16870, partial [Terriglobia bacterium]
LMHGYLMAGMDRAAASVASRSQHCRLRPLVQVWYIGMTTQLRQRSSRPLNVYRNMAAVALPGGPNPLKL